MQIYRMLGFHILPYHTGLHFISTARVADTPITYFDSNADSNLCELRWTLSVLLEPVSNLDKAIHACICRSPKPEVAGSIPAAPAKLRSRFQSRNRT